jgi:parvulin-like peptidyl-prolyl isomerase
MLLALVASLSLFAAEPAATDPVIAKVEGFEIHASEFAQAAKRARPADGKALSEAERQEVLDQLVGERLLLAEAKRDPTVYDDRAVREAMVKALLRADAEKVGTPTDAQLSSYYEANKTQFMSPDQARVSRILVRVSAKRDAKAAQAEAKKLLDAVSKDPKGTFAATAKASSQDPNRAEGGDMGLVTKTDKKLDPAMKRAIFSLKAGAVSGVVMTKEGANIFYVTNRKAPTQRTLEEAQADVERKWRAEQITAAKTARVQKLAKSGKISIDKAALAAVEVPVKGAGKGGKHAEDTEDDEDDAGDDE